MQTSTPAPASGWEQFNGSMILVAIGCVVLAYVIVGLINARRR